MTIVHHPDDATLMSYAAGSLPEALSAVIATHLVACPKCRHRVRSMEDVGAALVAALGKDGDRHPVAALRSPHIEDVAPLPAPAETRAPVDPIERLTGSKLQDIRWRRLGFGVWHYPIPLSGAGEGDLRLLKVQRGQAMPEHGHGGSELTIVLEGAFSDRIGTFRAGDVEDLGDDVEHRPIADPKDGCICLIACDRKVRFTGLIGRLLQPLTGM